MQIPISWINELVKIEDIELNSLIEKLTLGGFEVEDILEIEFGNQKQIALDISATANRSDSLSIQGISSEISSLLNASIKNSDYLIKSDNWKKYIESKTKVAASNSNYSIFVALVVENFSDTTIPKWMTRKLINSGITPCNTLVDFQNYILLETGYPVCIYDFEKLCLKLGTSNIDLSVSYINEKQSFLASNNIDYEIDNSTLTICANQVPISIAGIIEANDFTSSEKTNTLLIEGSIFSAAKIRQQSRKLGLRTERSARYEKSLKNTYLIESLYRLLFLLRIYNPHLICKVHTVSQINEENSKPILLCYETINEILGPINKINDVNSVYMSPELVTSYLTRLNFQFTFDSLNLNWNVIIPHSRTEDLTREIDLIEEIGRLHGFNNFLTLLPQIKKIGNEDDNYKTRKKVTTCLLNLGFNELIHYSLVNEKTFIENEIQLINPLVLEHANLRSSLLPNLIKTVKENLKQKNVHMEGFEYGHVFFRDKLNNLKEKEYVAGIFGGMKTKLAWSSNVTELHWFEAKGKIEQLFKHLNFVINWKIATSKKLEKIFHPYRSADIYLNDKTSLGVFGQINPVLATQLNLSSDIYLFEFDLEIIKKELEKNKIAFYREYSMYPKIIKDISFIIPKDIEFQTIKDVLYLNGTEFLAHVNLLDEYRGQSIPENQTSLCLQLVFQSSKKTLENKEIENIINKLQLALINKFNAIIRT
jgi:phenylalanyl-tRNA synthetase beta chain